MTAPPKSSSTPPAYAAAAAAAAAPTARGRAGRWRPSPSTLRKLALGALIANIAIVASGGLVRLTGSGLGCPSWPNCANGSLVPTQEVSWHKGIEFGNRLITGVVLAAGLAVLIAVLRSRPRRPDLRVWAWLTLLGVPAQAVMGGVTVLTDLNPWAVAAHFVLSMLLVAAATVLWWRTRAPERAAQRVHPLLSRLAWATWAVTYAVFCVGTVVTGSGPHAGDPSARRIGVTPESIAQLHTDLVMLLVGMSLALAVAVTATGAGRAVRGATRLLLGALVVQAAIGYAQYFDKLPIGLVEAHLFGAACIAAAATAVVAAMTSADSTYVSNG